MPLYNSGYGSTYTPNYMKGAAQDRSADSSIFSSPLYASSPSAPAPSSSLGSGNPSLAPYNPQASGNSNPLNVNWNPAASNPWATPGSVQVGSNSTNNIGQDTTIGAGLGTLATMGSPVGGAVGGTIGGAIGNMFGSNQASNTPINQQLPFANPLQPLVNQMQSSFLSSNMNPFRGSPGPVLPNGTNSTLQPGVQSLFPGTYTGPSMPGYASGSPLFSNTPAGMEGYVTGAPVHQMAPWDVSQIFQNMNSSQWGTFANNSNPYEMEQAFNQSAQNYANAFANPGFSSFVNGNSGQQNTQATFDNWLSNAYDTYVNQMNANHRF